MSESRAALPAVLDRPVRMASVPSYLWDVFEHLPVPLALEAMLPEEPEAISLAARQLLKLSLSASALRLERLSLHAQGPARLLIRQGPRQCLLEGHELSQGITEVARRVLGEVLDKEHFAQVLEVFAFQSSNLEVLRTLTHHMLRASELDHALYVMLSGITSGEALGFNRVALFLYEEKAARCVGSKAIGPADAEEAHRIWEIIEYESQTIEQQIEAIAQRDFNTPFQQLVQGITLAEQGEVAEACGVTGPVLFTRERPEHEGLARLSPAHQFVLAVIQMHGRRKGLIFADNVYSGAQVPAEQLRFLRFLLYRSAGAHLGEPRTAGQGGGDGAPGRAHGGAQPPGARGEAGGDAAAVPGDGRGLRGAGDRCGSVQGTQ